MSNIKQNIYYGYIDDTIKQAIKKIKKNGTRTLIISDKNSELLGTLSEGDIQKVLINEDVTLNDKILNYYNKNPKKIIFKNLKKIDMRQFFIDGQFGLVPVTNEENKILDIITWKDIFLKYQSNLLKNIDVIIMAGGKGTRLRPITEILPKPLVPVDGKPILEHIIENFKYFGFNKFVLTINHQANLIKSYFNSKDKNYQLIFVKEKKALGTAGGISLIKKKLSQHFIITNCDTLYKIDYEKYYNFHLKNKNDITLAIADKKFNFPYGACKISSGKLISLKEKPSMNFSANVGLYLMKNNLKKMIKKNVNLDMTDLIQKCLNLRKKIGVFKIKDHEWTDLGQLSDLKKNYY